MACREVDVIEVREVLRWWLDGAGLRTIAERAGVDRKTPRRNVEAAQAAGLSRDAGQAALCDGLIGAVIAGVRPGPPERSRRGVGPAGGPEGEDHQMDQGRPDDREDGGAADPVRHDGAVSDVAPVGWRGVRLPGPRHYGAGPGW